MLGLAFRRGGHFYYLPKDASGKKWWMKWRCRLLWPPGVTLPFNDCTAIVWGPHTGDLGLVAISCGLKETLKAQMLLICFRTCAGCHFSPQPAICLHLFHATPRCPSHLFLPEPPSQMLFLPPQAKVWTWACIITPAVCSRLGNFTKLCRSYKYEKVEKKYWDRTLDLCNSSSVNASPRVPAKCLSLTHTHTRLALCCTGQHPPLLHWNQNTHRPVWLSHKESLFS